MRRGALPNSFVDMSLQEAAEDPVAWERLGDLYLAHDRPGLAIECYTGSLELDADRGRPVYLRAWAHHDLGDLKNARSDIERALELDPATTHLKWRAAGWMAEEGDLDAAVSMAQSDLRAVKVLNRWARVCGYCCLRFTECS